MTGGWVRVLATAEQVGKKRPGMERAAKAGLVRIRDDPAASPHTQNSPSAPAGKPHPGFPQAVRGARHRRHHRRSDQPEVPTRLDPCAVQNRTVRGAQLSNSRVLATSERHPLRR